jgi:uncharacterized protein (DUF305 family)
MTPVANLPRPVKIVAGVVAVLLLVLVGYTANTIVARSSTPGDSSPEAGFARDMSNHHAQAVELGMIAFQKATLPEVRNLGGDIALTQQAQIGMMQTWLYDWGLQPTTSAPPMAWMPDGQQALNNGLMPGMATQTEMDQIRNATGKEVDILFCQYMLRHHLGGIHMVEGLLAESSNPQVTALATTMKVGQTGEITTLRSLLSELGAQPLT